MARVKLATVWLGGCSGCHMSFLDLDEWLLELAKYIDLVFSPIADVKTYPEGVDIALVEGAIANTEHLDMIRLVRDRTQYLISFGDCAVTGNVTAIRNVRDTPESVLNRAYIEAATMHPQVPQGDLVPALIDQVMPVHQVVSVDYYLPGCPPNDDRIRAALETLLRDAGGLSSAENRPPLSKSDLIRFG